MFNKVVSLLKKCWLPSDFLLVAQAEYRPDIKNNHCTVRATAEGSAASSVAWMTY